MKKIACVLLLFFVTAVTPGAVRAQTEPQTAPPSAPSEPPIAATYVLGPGDQIMIRAFELPEISAAPFRIESGGTLDLPLLGIVKASGLNMEELESEILRIIRAKQLVKEPQVTVNLTQFRHEPVFLTGSFQSPGVYAVQNFSNLSTLILGTGGLLPGSSRRIKVSRRLEFGEIPVPQATVDRVRNLSIAEIDLADTTNKLNSAEDITLKPFDVISAKPSELVFVQGEMGSVSGFPLEGRPALTVTQLVSLAGGPAKFAGLENATVMRPIAGTPRRAAIPINLKRILAGRDRDFPLQADDVLYVPRSRSKVFWNGFRYIAIPLVSIAIWRTLR
jgi:polysaccharide biosynthesis/export protein